eukprot:TRINITY_DN1637_c0_g1_i1.p1 TRINITY_DN1637_c0_g1~~TRINITY_DN1637_c0_g1_i1.p1  ORF type:complete len:667 (+),score=191.36 TRINITY_DN1637_c0_g1_i1:75-2003(+)
MALAARTVAVRRPIAIPSRAFSSAVGPATGSDDARLHALFPTRPKGPPPAASKASTTKVDEPSSLSVPEQMALEFRDPRKSFESKSLLELIRAFAVFQTCRVGPVVRNCDALYSYGIKLAGPTLTHGVLRYTMFDHFCAGETAEGIVPRLEELRGLGVGGILDYAAEAKDEAADCSQAQASSSSSGDADACAAQPFSSEAGELLTDMSSKAEAETVGAPLSSRKYDYQGEAMCDANTEIFLDAIRAVKHATPEGYAAIKLSGLGNPVLLERMSTCIVEKARLFQRFSVDDDSVDPKTPFYLIDRSMMLDFDGFCAGWRRFFSDKSCEDLRAKFNEVDEDKDGLISYFDWTASMKLSEINKLVRECKVKGPMYHAALDEEEVQLYMNIVKRTQRIFDLAKELDVRVMVDAEWMDIQPAIDHMVIFMQRLYNTGEVPIVYQTYQTYLKGMENSVERDLVRAKAEGYRFGAKVVRGAYMVSEREKAKQRQVESPINETYEDTEEMFHRVIDRILAHNLPSTAEAAGDKAANKAVGPGRDAPAEVLVASHNRGSVEYVVKRMEELGKDKTDVSFGQLLGMADNLTFTLGAHGYKAYKYVPYGPIDEVVPYLIRRTQENSSILGSDGVQEERKMISKEIRRRMCIPF